VKPLTTPYAQYTDGLWLPESIDYGTPPNALTVADNVEYTMSGGVRGMRGRSLWKDLSGTGSPIRMLYRFYPRTGDPATLVAIDVGASTSFYYATGQSDSFSAATNGTGYADALTWYGVTWPSQNKMYLANGDDPLKSFNGTTIAGITSIGTAGYLDPVPDGPYLAIHKSRLWATKSDELNYSVYASDVNDPTAFLGTSQLSVNDPRGGRITGLASFNDFLLIFKSQSVWRFIGDISTLTGAQLARYCDYGCVAPDSIAVTPYGVLYVGRSGVFMTDGVAPVPSEMSQPIRSLFTARATETKYETAVGKWYPRRNQYVLELDPTAGIAYILTRLDVLYQNDYIGAFSRPVWIWAKKTSQPGQAGQTMSNWFGDSDDGRFLIGDSAGKIWMLDTDSQTTDAGDTITSKIRTMSRPFSVDGMTGRVCTVKALNRDSAALTGSIYYDQHTSADSTFSVGRSRTVVPEWNRAQLFDFDKQGRMVSVELSSTSSYNFELNIVSLDYKLLAERWWQEAAGG
jgi:hypothetical protein